ncbi:MAG: GNAT family N-acetyltransferase [Oscillospiraceae bacterium]
MTSLETSRLIMREWLPSDCDDLFEYACIPEVALSAGWNPHKTIEDSLEVICGIYPDSCYALELKDSGKVIGNIGFHETSLCRSIRCLRSREIGFNLNPKYWNSGYMTEAATAVCDFSFDVLNMDYLWLAHFPDNYRSKRIAQKLGFRFVCNHRQSVAQLDGQTVTERLYIKLNRSVFA